MADRVTLFRDGAKAHVVEGDVERFKKLGYGEVDRTSRKAPARRRKSSKAGGA